jgi:hypothetical protein
VLPAQRPPDWPSARLTGRRTGSCGGSASAHCGLDSKGRTAGAGQQQQCTCITSDTGGWKAGGRFLEAAERAVWLGQAKNCAVAGGRGVTVTGRALLYVCWPCAAKITAAPVTTHPACC